MIRTRGGKQETGLELAALRTRREGLQLAQSLSVAALLTEEHGDLPVHEPPAGKLQRERGGDRRGQRGLLVSRGEVYLVHVVRQTDPEEVSEARVVSGTHHIQQIGASLHSGDHVVPGAPEEGESREQTREDATP